jgi:hypothetical protein
MQAKGTVSGGVLNIELDRDDIGDVRGPLGVIFTPSFEINGNVFFQPLAGGRALMNGDLALKPDELQPFIDALLRNGLVFQAFHQHLPDLDPPVWFMHFRGVGGPLDLARAAHAAVRATATPLPQAPPAHPTTPLDPERLGRILHGEAEVGGEGVVTVSVLRRNRFILGGVRARSETNLMTTVEFKPLGGSRCRRGARLRAGRRGGRSGHARDARTRVVRRLPVQPGNGRASAAVLLAPAEDRECVCARPRDPARAEPHALGVIRRFVTR